jgi:hypothetical protein
VGHDTPVSDQVSDNGTEHSGISVPGPGRLATGKIIKRRPSEVLSGRRGHCSNLRARLARTMGTSIGLRDAERTPGACCSAGTVRPSIRCGKAPR